MSMLRTSKDNPEPYHWCSSSVFNCTKELLLWKQIH